MSKFHEAPLDELLDESTEEETPEERHKRIDQERLDAIIRADMEEMIKESRNQVHLNYPTPIGPAWKN